jgi:hypothetical protein
MSLDSPDPAFIWATWQIRSRHGWLGHDLGIATRACPRSVRLPPHRARACGRKLGRGCAQHTRRNGGLHCGAQYHSGAAEVEA